MNQGLERQTVLVVDDAIINIQVINKILGEKYKVTFATSGAKALELIAQQAPNLVLLDVMMPEMDGYETLDKIRSNHSPASLPVFFLTSLDDEASIDRAKEVGANGVIHKPVDRTGLLELVAGILE